MTRACPSSLANSIDPITAVFWGYGTADRSLNHVQAHTGWDTRPAPKYYFSSWGDCGETYGERASGTYDRFHVRARRTARDHPQVGITALATPHHEDHIVTDEWDCFHAVDKGGVDRGEGWYSGFDWGRDELVAWMRWYSDHHPVEYVQWNNTREFKQCDEDWAGSHGAVAWIYVPYSYH